MLLMHCEQLKDSNSSVEIFFEGNPALLGNITLFNTKANWFNTYNEIRYVDRKYVFANSVLTLVGKHTLKVLAAVMQFLNSISNNLMQCAPGKKVAFKQHSFPTVLLLENADLLFKFLFHNFGVYHNLLSQ